MSDSNDVVQRNNDINDTKTNPVVDLGHNAPKQDLWDIDDDIFKPLLERIEAERAEEARENAVEKNQTKAENYVGAFGSGMGGHQFSISPDLGLISRDHSAGAESESAEHVIEKPVNRRKSVLENGGSPVTIRSEAPSMPRVVWSTSKNKYKKLVDFFDKLPSRVQLVLSAVSMFAIWNIIALFTAREASLMFFDYDPFYAQNWQQLYKLYQSGSTFQWSFVLFYMTMFVVIPMFGILLSIRAAGEFRPVIGAILKPLTWALKFVLQSAAQIMGFAPKPIYKAKPVPAYVQAGGRTAGYRGATFKKDGSVDDTTTGGSISGGGGGGHGRPSWQGGPANTQAFPRTEQGRR